MPRRKSSWPTGQPWGNLSGAVDLEVGCGPEASTTGPIANRDPSVKRWRCTCSGLTEHASHPEERRRRVTSRVTGCDRLTPGSSGLRGSDGASHRSRSSPDQGPLRKERAHFAGRVALISDRGAAHAVGARSAAQGRASTSTRTGRVGQRASVVRTRSASSTIAVAITRASGRRNAGPCSQRRARSPRRWRGSRAPRGRAAHRGTVRPGRWQLAVAARGDEAFGVGGHRDDEVVTPSRASVSARRRPRDARRRRRGPR